MDELRLCARCHDRETTSDSGVCHVCIQQDIIDDVVPDAKPTLTAAALQSRFNARFYAYTQAAVEFWDKKYDPEKARKLERARKQLAVFVAQHATRIYFSEE